MSFWRRSRQEREMAEELRFHLEEQMQRNLAAGMAPEEAARAAQRQFGHLDRIQEEARDARGWRWLDELRQDLRYGARMLRRHPGFTAVAIVSLAIGIGLNTAVFSIINTVFYQDIRGVPEPRRVLIFNDGGTSLVGFQLLREQTNQVAAITAARATEVLVQSGETERRVRVVGTAADYFTVLGAKPALGRFFLPPTSAIADQPHAHEAVITDSFWERHLGRDRAVLGTQVRLNGLPVTIVGVAARDFHGPGPEAPAMWVPRGLLQELEQSAKQSAPEHLGLIGRLRPGASLGQAQAAIATIVERSPEVFGETRFRLSLGREDWRGEISPAKRVEYLLVTTVPLVVAGAMLWITCSNVGNLLLARAVRRRKEIAIRVAGGATRARLVRMLMVESLLLALLGGAAGLWMSRATLDFVFATLSEFGNLSVQMDSRVLLYTSGLCVVAALLFGLVPALQASKTDVSATLKGESDQPTFRGSRLRTLFLAGQIACSVALLVVAGIFIKTLLGNAHSGPQGRLLDHLVAASIPAPDDSVSDIEFRETLVTQIKRLPGVEAVTRVESRPQQHDFIRPGEWAADTAHRVAIALQRIDAEYADVVGLNLQQGSWLSPSPVGHGHEALVNEGMVNALWPGSAVVGSGFELGGERYLITGVVRDGGLSPAAYTHLPAAANGDALWIRTRQTAAEAAPLIARTLRPHARPHELVRVSPLRDVMFRSLQVMTQLATYIGCLALALAAAGIYASVSFSTQQRTREIGVRMALGASRRSVLALVLRGGFKVIGWGAAAGLLLALIGLRLLTALFGGAGWGVDYVAITAVVAGFAAVATAGCLVPAWRGARISPLEALRTEG